jgi:hypothetical protein
LQHALDVRLQFGLYGAVAAATNQALSMAFGGTFDVGHKSIVNRRFKKK